jgi:hypothetical protein
MDEVGELKYMHKTFKAEAFTVKAANKLEHEVAERFKDLKTLMDAMEERLERVIESDIKANVLLETKVDFSDWEKQQQYIK